MIRRQRGDVSAGRGPAGVRSDAGARGSMTMPTVQILLVIVAGLIAGCGANAPTASPPARPSLQSVGARFPVELNAPPGAIVSDGVASVVLVPGFGPSRPVSGRRQLLGVAFIAYGDDGTVSSVTPFAFQEYDTSRADWRSVYGQMVAGEVRRVWLQKSGKVRVYDVELQSIGEAR